MNVTDVTIPVPIRASCINCETTRVFSPISTNQDDLTVTYECKECEQQTVELRVDP